VSVAVRGAWGVLTAAVLLAGGCRAERSVALVYYIDGTSPSVRRVVDAVLDSLNRDADLIVRLVPQDTTVRRGESQLLREVYRALEATKDPAVVAAVGLPGSSDVMTVGPIFRDAGIPLVVPTANAPQLERLGSETFLMAPTLQEEVRFIGDVVTERLGARSVTIVYNPGAWGAGLQAQLAAELWQRGVRVLGSLPVPSIECEQDPVLRRYVSAALRRGRPDVVVLASYEICLALEFERQAPGITFLAGDGLVVTSDWVRSHGELGRRFHAVGFWNPEASSADAAAFRRLFAAINGASPTWADAAQFDATMLTVAAVRAAGTDREAVARQLYQFGRKRSAYAGVTGPIAFMSGHGGRLTLQAFDAVGSEP